MGNVRFAERVPRYNLIAGACFYTGGIVSFCHNSSCAFSWRQRCAGCCCSHRQVQTMSRVWGRHAPTRSLRKCGRIEELKSRMDRKFSRIENLWPRDGSCPLPLRSKLIFNKCFRIVKTQKISREFRCSCMLIAVCSERSSYPCLCSGVDGKSVSRSVGS